MKNIISLTIYIALITLCYSHNLQSHNTTGNQEAYKTFLVKTKLSKKELETLLQEGEVQLVNLKKNKNHTNATLIQKINNTTNLTDATLEQKIEQEIKEDALHPIHEFHVNPNEVTTLVTTKTGSGFINYIHEKRFGKFWAYVTLFLFVFLMMKNKDIILSQKNINKKKSYINNYDYYNEKEYMLDKNN